MADLTYTQQQISSEAMPAAIGGIATFTETSLGLIHPIRIFKYPEKLSSVLENDGIPDIIGFSNYMWDLELSLGFARTIKEVSPKTITVFGGPNYPVIATEQERFLRSHPEIDFYVKREGELGLNLLLHYSGKAFTQCVSELVDLSRHTLHKLLKENEKDTEENLAFVEDALVFDSCRYKNIFKDIESEPTVTLNYEIHRFVEEKNPSPIENYHLKRPLTFKFTLDKIQKDTIKRSLQNYDADDVGISRIMTRVILRKLLRKPVIDSQIPSVLVKS